VLRIWCPAHQIDIVVKASSEGIFKSSWIKVAFKGSLFLRAQDNLIISMNVKCPKKTNRWVHLGRLLNFYKQYRRQLISYTNEKRPHEARRPIGGLPHTRSPRLSTQSMSPLLCCRTGHLC
jgi:hypothetical protein